MPHVLQNGLSVLQHSCNAASGDVCRVVQAALSAAAAEPTAGARALSDAADVPAALHDAAQHAAAATDAATAALDADEWPDPQVPRECIHCFGMSTMRPTSLCRTSTCRCQRLPDVTFVCVLLEQPAHNFGCSLRRPQGYGHPSSLSTTVRTRSIF